MTNEFYSTGWFYKLNIHSQNKTNSILPSGLEVAFVLDSGGSVLVLKIPEYKLIIHMFNVIVMHDTSKTLIFANQSEVQIRQFFSGT